MFGEIDCRLDEEGILFDHKKPAGHDLSKAIYELVQSYVEYVTTIFAPRGITPVFYGVLVRMIRKGYRYSDDEMILSSVIKKFNHALVMETIKKRLHFLDVYSLTNDANS